MIDLYSAVNANGCILGLDGLFHEFPFLIVLLKL